MAEMILPGVYIEERAEGLIAPGLISVGNLGVVGTASKGPLWQPVLLGSFQQARDTFGDYDQWQGGGQNELTLVRALELAYNAGANTVFAVRVSSKAGQNDKALAAGYTMAGDGNNKVAAKLAAASPGTWGNKISVNVWDADQDSVIVNEQHDGGAAITLNRHPVAADNPRNRVSVLVAATGQTRVLAVVTTAPQAGQVKIAANTGALTFAAGEDPAAGDKVSATYIVPMANSRKVTLRYLQTTEVYTVADGAHLVDQLSDPAGPSALAVGTNGADAATLPKKHNAQDEFREFGKGTDTAGSDGADASQGNYKDGFDLLLNEPAHIMVAAGLDNEAIGDELSAHCDKASTDEWKHERIGVVGSKVNATLNDMLGHTLSDGRMIFAGPGIHATDAASGQDVVLPGAYTAAVIAAMLSARSPHISLTNKSVPVGALEDKFDPTELKQLVLARVLAVEERRGLGIRVVKGITTDPGAFTQITTRRIVDYAKYGVRSAAEPYIGLLNNERVRGALRATINSFLAEMVEDEMLTKYLLDVTATRSDEIKGICRVTMTLLPTFSIDYIKVTMYLQ